MLLSDIPSCDADSLSTTLCMHLLARIEYGQLIVPSSCVCVQKSIACVHGASRVPQQSSRRRRTMYYVVICFVSLSRHSKQYLHAQRSARKRVAVGRDREWIAGPARSWPAIGVHLERVSVPVRFVQASSLGRLRSAEQRQPASQAAGRSQSRHVPSLDALH